MCTGVHASMWVSPGILPFTSNLRRVWKWVLTFMPSLNYAPGKESHRLQVRFPFGPRFFFSPQHEVQLHCRLTFLSSGNRSSCGRNVNLFTPLRMVSTGSVQHPLYSSMPRQLLGWESYFSFNQCNMLGTNPF